MNILKRYVKCMIEEARIAASPEYMNKEKIREKYQALILDAVKSGLITDQQSLLQYFKDADMSLNALKMIPVEVWIKMSSTKRK